MDGNDRSTPASIIAATRTMPALAPGSRIGPYEVIGSLGEGGMGEVYRARDSRLKRDVAIKILPGRVASDPDRVARFQREAEVLASLNHPHIANIYGFEHEGDTRALVLELVEGETLAERMARGPIALEDLVPIAKQITQALEAAHEQGVIHRNLKPANIKVTPDGRVKVLDFGLAKLAESVVSSTAAPPGSRLRPSPFSRSQLESPVDGCCGRRRRRRWPSPASP